MNRSIALFMFATALATCAFGAGDAKAGKVVYDKSCKSCHGTTGMANPAIAKMMKVEMKDLSAADVQSHTNEALEKVIGEGQGKMKPIKTVTGKAVDDVVAYIRTFKK